MNERIRELAEQNGFIHQWMPPGEQHDLLQRYEKFAQLIVRESIVDFYRLYLDLESKEDITQQVNRYVKDNFGVE
jgi:hypothetical protein